jgi:hypothetical protein
MILENRVYVITINVYLSMPFDIYNTLLYLFLHLLYYLKPLIMNPLNNLT